MHNLIVGPASRGQFRGQRAFGRGTSVLLEQLEMAYTSYAPNSTLTTMCKSYSDFVDELDKLKKAKGDKNKIKELEQQLKLKGVKIKTQLDEEMVGIAANFQAHALKIEKLLGDGAKAVQDAKDALKRFQANPKLTKDQGEAEIAVPRLQALVKQAQDDALDYGKSWFEWRAWNGKSAYGLDDSVIKDFFTTRRKLMADQKQVGSKIDKLELLVKAAEGVKKEAQSEGKLATKALSQSRTEMAILRTDMGIVYKRIQGEKGKSLSVFVQNCQSLAKNAAGEPVSADLAGLCADIWVNAVACVKFYREIHKSLEERLKSQLKVLDPSVLEDDVVKKELLACKALVDKANTDKVTAENALKVAANNNAKIQKTAAKK